MATATSTPSYLSQYLTDYQAGRPDLAQIGQRTATTTGLAQVPDQTATVKSAEAMLKALPGYSPIAGRTTGPAAVGQAAIAGFQSQVQAAQQQQAIQAEALRTKAEASQAYIEGIRALAPAAVAGMEESLAAWNKVGDRGDQYWKDSIARVAEATQEFKATVEKWAAQPDSALAHSIQSSSYAWLQTNKATERAIAERYGTDSAEYRDYLDAKRTSIGAMVSDLTAKSWDRTQQILNTGLGALGGLMATGIEHLGWAQKNTLDGLQAAAAATDQLLFQTSSYLLLLSQAENTEWAELANWYDQTQVMAVEATPLLSQLLELQEQSQPAQTTSWGLSSIPAHWSKSTRATA